MRLVIVAKQPGLLPVDPGPSVFFFHHHYSFFFIMWLSSRVQEILDGVFLFLGGRGVQGVTCIWRRLYTVRERESLVLMEKSKYYRCN